MKRTISIVVAIAFGFATLGLEADSFRPVEINTEGNPDGYYEYLPTAYGDNPADEFPVVIFFHGLGETGDGTLAEAGQSNNGKLQELLVNGPPAIVNNSGDPLHEVFENNDAIMLAPQHTGWWNAYQVREFLDYALETYRIDDRRIYLTGLSAGSAGLHDFMNNDSSAEQATAYVVCALRGQVDAGMGDYLGTRSAYWALTAVHAGGNERGLGETSVANLVAYRSGNTPPDIRSNYPGDTAVYSSYFDEGAGGWIWENGVPVNSDETIRLTLFTGNNHNSWGRTYSNANMWTWLFAQEKPEVEIVSPNSASLVYAGSPIPFTASASDAGGTAIPDGRISWSSSLDGDLGVGGTLLIDSLSIGVHTITCTATDDRFRAGLARIDVSVIYAGPFQAAIDIGDSTLMTSGNWNHLTNLSSGVIESVVASDGQPTGARVSVIQRFEGIQTGGVAASDLYPQTAQIDTFYVGSTHSEGILRISGLNPAQEYDFTLFASRNTGGYKISRYTFDGATTGQYVTLDASYNSATSVSIEDIVPNAEGIVDIRVSRHEPQGYAYLGVIEIQTTGAESTNQPPFVSAGSDQVLELGDDSYVTASLSGTAIDDGQPESGTLSTEWTIVSQPTGANGTFENAAAASTGFTADRPGNYTLQFSADDGELSNSDTLELSVSYPQNPYLRWREARFSTTELGDLSVSGHGADPDGNGWSNLAEYAFDEQPLVRSGRMQRQGEGLHFTFKRNPSATDLTYEILSKPTLEPGTWTPVAQSVEGAAAELIGSPPYILEETGHDPIEVTLQLTDSGASGGFFRVRLSTDQALLQNGVAYAFYEGSFATVPDFSLLIPDATGVQDGFELSASGAVQDYYAFRFDALIEIAEAGTYTFYTNSDDGSLLYIDDQLVVDNDGLHGALERSGSLSLSEGMHPIRVEFIEAQGAAILEVFYEGPGISKQPVPASVLFVTPDE